MASVLSREQAPEAAMAEAVGGYFDEFSQLMLKILVEAGLQPEHYLIDVGCGSGRLTKSAAGYLTGCYWGTDVVPALLENARKFGKPGWQFEEVSNIATPEQDSVADMVCFFSVLTHLLHRRQFPLPARSQARPQTGRPDRIFISRIPHLHDADCLSRNGGAQGHRARTGDGSIRQPPRYRSID